MEDQYDVLIIGGGVIGSAIARELSRYKLKTGVLEKNSDVCRETSGRNSGVIHGGFAYDTGTLKAKFCVEGNQMMEQLSDELDFRFERCGKVLVGNTREDMEALRYMMKQGEANGVRNLEIIDKKKLHELVPYAEGEFAMYSPESGITDPFNYTIALAENAHANGTDYYFNREVTGITRRKGGIYRITTGHEDFFARWVINSAGLGCGRISEMLGIGGCRVIGSKGDYIILDQHMGKLLPMPIYPVPDSFYMGVHVTNTVDGNVMIGPNAETVSNFSDYGVTGESIADLAKNASRLWPHIRKGDYIRCYSGILPKWVNDAGEIQDFRIEIRDDLAPNAVNLVGIESPGLTAAVPIARYVIELMKQREKLKPNPRFNPMRKGIVRFADKTEEEQAALIAGNPDYGEIICRCEKVTRAEILEAVHNPLGVNSMTGIKYRTRSMMGRCQGGYCQMRIANILETELGMKETEVRYAGQGSQMFFGKVRKEVK